MMRGEGGSTPEPAGGQGWVLAWRMFVIIKSILMIFERKCGWVVAWLGGVGWWAECLQIRLLSSEEC